MQLYLRQQYLQMFLQQYHMSLFLLGSCSKITSSIVKRLAQENIYKKIVIGDIMPSYSLFKRFYNLKKELNSIQTNTIVDLLKINTLDTLNQNIAESSDILFVTHDYAKNVISKTTLIKEAAEDAKNSQDKTILYVSPAEYDSYFFKDPYREYLNGETVIKRKLPNANIIRTDPVENAEFHEYYQDVILKGSFFKPVPQVKNLQLVRQKNLLDEVVRILTKKPTGESLLLRGDTPAIEVTCTNKAQEVLDPFERLFDTWGMKSNLNEFSKMSPNELHSFTTGKYTPQTK